MQLNPIIPAINRSDNGFQFSMNSSLELSPQHKVSSMLSAIQYQSISVYQSTQVFLDIRHLSSCFVFHRFIVKPLSGWNKFNIKFQSFSEK